MKYRLFSRVALTEDLIEHGLVRGDIGTVVEYYEPLSGAQEREPGYELEIFDALGNTLDVVTVRESQLQALQPNSVLSMREMSVV